MAQPESKLSRDILNALRARGIFAFKVHGGPTMMAGLPDIIACVPVWLDVMLPSGDLRPMATSVFVGFETKTPSGGDPSPIQSRVHGNIRSANGLVFVPRTVQDAVDAVETIIGHSGTQPM